MSVDLENHTIRFISETISEITKLSVVADLPVVTYLLQMAQLEADNHIVRRLKKNQKRLKQYEGERVRNLVASAP